MHPRKHWLSKVLAASLRSTVPAAAAIGTCLATNAVLAQVAEAPVVNVHAAPRPNIVLIMADDMGVETVNAYGGEYRTPNLDEMARDGMLFEHAHAMPLCTPSRARLMTGIENARSYEAFGYLSPEQRTFGNLLREAGYATAIAGKWQLSGNGFDGRIGITPEQAGFDEALLWQVTGAPARGSRYWGPTLWQDGQHTIHEAGFGPELINDFAREFVRRHRDESFFLYYPMVLPHSPFVPTPADPAVEGEQARFAAMIEYLDDMVGRLLTELETQGVADNTIVIFIGDNGTHRQITSIRNGHAVRGGKGQPTLTGTHVPMIVRWPAGVAKGVRSVGLFDFTDFFPTFAELAGAALEPAQVDGVSQLPVFTGEEESVRDTIFMHYAPAWIQQPARFVFDADYKLYGDGTFVQLNTQSGEEVSIINPEGEAERRLAEFERILADANDGPLDPTRFPMCEGKPSLNPDIPATIAGCPRDEGMQINE